VRPMPRSSERKVDDMGFEAALVEERERRRIAAGLHDGVGQSLALAQLKLSSVRDELVGIARTTVDDCIALIAQSIAELRTLSFELSPPVLYDLGLPEALSWLSEDLGRRCGIKVDLADDEIDKPLSPVAAALVFRAVRELLINVVKHAKCQTCKVQMRRKGDDLHIEVRDQGVGFEAYATGLESAQSGFGLPSVREQLSRIGGRVAIASGLGKGTRVSIMVPLQSEATKG